MRSSHRIVLEGAAVFSRTLRLGVLFVAAAAFSAGCASMPAHNYLDTAGPRYAGDFSSNEAEADGEETFLVVSFNVKMGEEPHNALKVLRDAGLDHADLLLLQEMDVEATIEIAASLGFNYVYYPAAVHPWSQRLFGVAVLSPWPIQRDRKICLPNFTDSRDPAAKVSMVAVTWVRGIPVGVVNAHLQLGLAPAQVKEQVRVIVDCAFSGDCESPQAPLLQQLQYVVLAGDFNTSVDAKMRAADEVLTEAGLRRVPGIGRTYKYLFFGLGKLDHIYTSPALEVEDSGQERGFFATGSDHFPVYARLRFNGEIPQAWQGFEPDESRSTPHSVAGTREQR